MGAIGRLGSTIRNQLVGRTLVMDALASADDDLLNGIMHQLAPRTFAMQMEALKRYRGRAEQEVTLQNVSVAEGGQAIVGNVTQAPRKNGREKATQEKAATPPPVRTDTNVVPMPSMDKSKEHNPLSVRRKSNK